VKTEITRAFKWGFFLPEQDARRLLQICDESMAKEKGPENRRTTIQAQLDDGSIVETANIDDVMALDNVGSKAVRRLSFIVDDGAVPSTWGITLTYGDGERRDTAKSWESITYSIRGNSRDWVFVTSAELEERIRKTRTLSWGYILKQRWMLPVVMMLGLGAAVSFGLLDRSSDAVPALEKAYNAGQFKNPIEASHGKVQTMGNDGYSARPSRSSPFSHRVWGGEVLARLSLLLGRLQGDLRPKGQAMACFLDGSSFGGGGIFVCGAY
jgi:hypothetical protein